MGGSNSKIPDLEVKITTWQTEKKDSESLFNYHAENEDYVFESIKRNTYIIKKGQLMVFKSDEPFFAKELGTYQLMNINPSRINYKLLIPTPPNTLIPLWVWRIVYFEPDFEIQNFGIISHAIKLSENDIIKIGKMVLKVNKMVILGNNEFGNEVCHLNPEEEKKTSLIIGQTLSPNLDGEQKYMNSLNSPSPKKEEEKKNEKVCRICLESDFTSLNPLIVPCNCKGTMKYIHLSCLKKWQENNFVKNVYKYAVSYFCKDLCELCKANFHDITGKLDQRASYFGIEKPNCSYVEFEQINDETIPDQRVKGKLLFHAKMDRNNTIIIGRGGDAEMRLNDISVSRNHAILHFRNNNFYLEDLKSKFGTLLKINNNIIIPKKRNFSIQSGKSILEFKTVIPFFACSKRSIDDEPEEDDDIEQNILEKHLAFSQSDNKEFITVRHILTQNGNNN